MKSLLYSLCLLVLVSSTQDAHARRSSRKVKPIYGVSLMNLTVQSKRVSGEPWDTTLEPKPDLMVQVFNNKRRIYTSEVINDRLTHRFVDATVTPIKLKRKQKSIPLRILVWDVDSATRELIAELFIKISVEELQSGSVFKLAGGAVDQLTLGFTRLDGTPPPPKSMPVHAPKAEEPAKAEEPKAEEPKAEEPKAEEPKAEEPKAEEPKAEEPKAEEPKAEEPKAEEPKAEEPKAEEPKAEEPKAEEPKAEEPKAEEPKAEEPKAEEPKAEESAE
jgi:hypothetical protein